MLLKQWKKRKSKLNNVKEPGFLPGSFGNKKKSLRKKRKTLENRTKIIYNNNAIS